jgi:hypothetical protein
MVAAALAEEVVMSATMTMRSAAPPDRHELRHPLEPFVVAACVVLNALIVCLAIALVWFGSAWLGRHPLAARHVDAFRALAIGSILAFPGTALGRHVRAYADRGNGIRLSKAQLSLCHELLVKACRKLGVDELPDLYLVPRSDLESMSAAYSIIGKRSLVAVSTELFGREWEKNERAIAFSIGHAVGALKLGHTRWWLELLTAYGVRLPFLRTPMRAVLDFSRDRCGATVEPDGISGLIIQAAGKELVRKIDVASFVDQAMHYGGFWAIVASMGRKRPHLMLRARLLYDAKFFDYERDIAAFARTK